MTDGVNSAWFVSLIFNLQIAERTGALKYCTFQLLKGAKEFAHIKSRKRTMSKEK